MEEETNNNNNPNFFLPMDYTTINTSDLDLSFSSTASTSTFASTSSTRSSLSLNLPSLSPSITSLIDPLPHSKSNSNSNSCWSSLRAAANLSKDGNLHLHHLRILRHVGSGHLAKVFHCRLNGSDSFDFALKVINLEASAGKLSHVKTEAQVLASLDHPFLPTLYARLDASHCSCFLIDYCPGGDLHSLLVRHPGHRLPISAVRFFAAEVLLALEYLHAQGFVYRDLKPENVLIRSNGHIMLSDFDLCFSSEVNPRLDEELELVAEPEGKSRACVGTHEYLAPEIVNGNGHGSGVDWWAFGIFVYELLYGRTPFKGSSKEATLKNIMKRELRFSDPFENDEMNAARDLIRRLLMKDPRKRLGSRRGAAEIKKHEFFEGVKWPLIRSLKSPVAVGPKGTVVVKEGKSRGWSKIISLCYKKGIKIGLMGSNNKRKGSKKDKRRM